MSLRVSEPMGERGRFRSKIRGILGLGLVGGAVGFGVGAIWGGILSVLRSGIVFDVDYLPFLLTMVLGNAKGFMMIGAFTAAGFGGLLAMADSRRSLEELPLWRMGLFGALVGAAFPPIFVVWRMGVSAASLSYAVTLLPVMGVLGCAGGVLTASMVALAKRAPEELPPGDGARDMVEADEGTESGAMGR